MCIRDRGDTDANGDFTLKMDETLPAAIYRLRIGAGKLFLVLEEMCIRDSIATHPQFCTCAINGTHPGAVSSRVK